MYSPEQIQKMHCGMIAATVEQVADQMPELIPVVDLIRPLVHVPHYRFDIKVHMLMPGQWPCIPGWHCDFVPRDEDNHLCPNLIQDDAPPMFLWLSGPPLTEFEDGRRVTPGEWVRFTQRDRHRGTKAKAHGWRVFVRAAHHLIIPDRVLDISGLRRHSQVYLEADFTW